MIKILKYIIILVLIVSIFVSVYIDNTKKDNIFKFIGIKEYTKEDIVNRIDIDTNNNMLKDIIKVALFKTDNNTLKYIKTVNVISKYRISITCEGKSLGCADINFKNKKISYANIYISDLSGYKGTCKSFLSVLYHEIGHIDDAKKNGYYKSVSFVTYDGKEQNIYDRKEANANDYANKYVKDRCNSNKYLELKNHLKNTEEIVNKTQVQLEYWNRYGSYVPYELYEKYQDDYNANVKAINNYNYIVKEINKYIDSDEDIIY